MTKLTAIAVVSVFALQSTPIHAAPAPQSTEMEHLRDQLKAKFPILLRQAFRTMVSANFRARAQDFTTTASTYLVTLVKANDRFEEWESERELAAPASPIDLWREAVEVRQRADFARSVATDAQLIRADLAVLQTAWQERCGAEALSRVQQYLDPEVFSAVSPKLPQSGGAPGFYFGLQVGFNADGLTSVRGGSSSGAMIGATAGTALGATLSKIGAVGCSVATPVASVACSAIGFVIGVLAGGAIDNANRADELNTQDTALQDIQRILADSRLRIKLEAPAIVKEACRTMLPERLMDNTTTSQTAVPLTVTSAFDQIADRARELQARAGMAESLQGEKLKALESSVAFSLNQDDRASLAQIDQSKFVADIGKRLAEAKNEDLKVLDYRIKSVAPALAGLNQATRFDRISVTDRLWDQWIDGDQAFGRDSSYGFSPGFIASTGYLQSAWGSIVEITLRPRMVAAISGSALNPEGEK